jgi:hypothetical protein
MKAVSAVMPKTESGTRCANDAWNEDTIPRSHTPPRLFTMTNETIPGESQPRRMDLAAEGRLNAHPPTPAETWAEESPAFRDPVEYTASAEEDFWRANHQSQSYAGESSYGYFAPAYRTGYEGYARYGEGHTFEEAEPLLQEEYEYMGGKLEWTAARRGAKAAWIRLEQRHLIARTRQTTAPVTP